MRLNVLRITCSIGTHSELIEGETDVRKTPKGWLGFTFNGQQYDACPACIPQLPAFIAQLVAEKAPTATVQVQPRSIADEAKALAAGVQP
jgi:hypothetical protein